MTLCKTMELPIHDGDEPRSSLFVAISHLLEQQRHVRGLGFHAGPPCTGCAKKIVNCTLQVASSELRSANSPLIIVPTSAETSRFLYRRAKSALYARS